MNFQKTVLIIGAGVLLFMLFFIGLAMKGLKKAQQYPPEIAACPDYWSKHSDGTCHKNKLNIGFADTISKCSTYDGKTDKKEWALDCDVQWDGVSNI